MMGATLDHVPSTEMSGPANVNRLFSFPQVPALGTVFALGTMVPALLAKNAGKTMNHRTLLGRIWGRDHMEDGSNYLKVHIKHLRQKLGDDATHPRYVLNERGIGYKFGEPEGSSPSPRPAA